MKCGCFQNGNAHGFSKGAEMEQARRILDGLNHCLPVNMIDAILDCATCPYDKPCHERENMDSISLPLALVEDVRSLCKELLKNILLQ